MASNRKHVWKLNHQGIHIMLKRNNVICQKTTDAVRAFMKKKSPYVNGFFYNTSNTTVLMNNDIIKVQVAGKGIITITPKGDGYDYRFNIASATALRRIDHLITDLDFGFSLFWDNKSGRPCIKSNESVIPIKRHIYSATQLVEMADV